MSFKNFSTAAVGLVMALSLSGCAALAAHHRALLGSHGEQPEDPISANWNVTFYVHDMKTPASFAFKVDGTRVTGTAYSNHTGAGTIRDGKWVDGKLSFTLDFKKHESIAISGMLKEGKLIGEFTTEGFTDKWEASRK